MSESIAVHLKRAAIILAEELDYARAAEKLSIPPDELRKQIVALEGLLCLRVFEPRLRKVDLTEEGRFLIRAFREALALHDRKASEALDAPDSCRTFLP